MTDPTLRQAHLEWSGDARFTVTAPSGHTYVLDGDGKEGPGPMVALLGAMGGCSGMDVVPILLKMQVGLTKCHVDVSGWRLEEHPRRYYRATLTFTLAGEGLTQAKGDRAVELSVTKYCSVMLSLRPDIAIDTVVVIEE
jgi:putative redox protein